MLSALDPSQNNQRLRALDPDLPLLASEAAIDIENILSNKSQDYTAIRNLANRLRNSISIGTSDNPPHSLMDSATLTVLGQAVAEAMRSGTLQRVDDLLSEAAKIARSLSSETLIENPDELKQARDFCVALSRAVMAYHKSIRDLHPSHPFRR